eukprot:6046455-Heterocapsa_arctica.AAC.1
MSLDVKSGLRIRPTDEQLIGAALSDDNRNVKFPNRDADNLRAGFELSQLDNIGTMAKKNNNISNPKNCTSKVS